MRSFGVRFLFIASLVYSVSSLLPLWKADFWWVRIWDFPRLQMGLLGLLVGSLYLLLAQHGRLKKALVFLLLASAGIADGYRIVPYTRLFPVESLDATQSEPGETIKILVANVLQFNPDSSALLRLIEQRSPDLVLLLEVDERWVKEVATLEKSHPYFKLHPLSNTYGLAFYSRFPLENVELKFLIEPEVPSIEADLILPSQQRVHIYGLHPRPPRPDSGDTTERDAELIQIARDARKQSTPVLVFGDLNDVAWSHTTRLFRRLSQLIDPRIGRGTFPTFHAAYPGFRFPIDHVFHSKEFRLNEIERLPEIGSDHFPLWSVLSLARAQAQATPPSLEPGDKEEASETLQKAKE